MPGFIPFLRNPPGNLPKGKGAFSEAVLSLGTEARVARQMLWAAVTRLTK